MYWNARALLQPIGSCTRSCTPAAIPGLLSMWRQDGRMCFHTAHVSVSLQVRCDLGGVLEVPGFGRLWKRMPRRIWIKRCFWVYARQFHQVEFQWVWSCLIVFNVHPSVHRNGSEKCCTSASRINSRRATVRIMWCKSWRLNVLDCGRWWRLAQADEAQLPCFFGSGLMKIEGNPWFKSLNFES